MGGERVTVFLRHICLHRGASVCGGRYADAHTPEGQVLCWESCFSSSPGNNSYLTLPQKIWGHTGLKPFPWHAQPAASAWGYKVGRNRSLLAHVLVSTPPVTCTCFRQKDALWFPPPPPVWWCSSWELELPSLQKFLWFLFAESLVYMGTRNQMMFVAGSVGRVGWWAVGTEMRCSWAAHFWSLNWDLNVLDGF